MSYHENVKKYLDRIAEFTDTKNFNSWSWSKERSNNESKTIIIG